MCFLQTLPLAYVFPTNSNKKWQIYCFSQQLLPVITLRSMSTFLISVAIMRDAEHRSNEQQQAGEKKYIAVINVIGRRLRSSVTNRTIRKYIWLFRSRCKRHIVCSNELWRLRTVIAYSNPLRDPFERESHSRTGCNELCQRPTLYSVSKKIVWQKRKNKIDAFQYYTFLKVAQYYKRAEYVIFSSVEWPNGRSI